VRPTAPVRAFTLIEAMVVVVIVGILAVVAVVGYRRWIRTTYMAEAQDMIAHIRASEESFRAENGVYLDVSGSLDNLYPTTQPGAFKTAWGATCSNCTHQWSQLNVQPQAPTAYAYALVAGGSQDALPTITVTPPATAPDISGLQAGPWYVVEAKGDVDGDQNFTRIYGFSSSSTLLVDNEGN
jgi:type IV pilus assembly protein PilA